MRRVFPDKPVKRFESDPAKMGPHAAPLNKSGSLSRTGHRDQFGATSSTDS